MDHWESADRIEPTLATEPTESRLATDPADPIDRIEPADPIDKIEPEEPMLRIDPLEPMLRIEPAEPTDHAGDQRHRPHQPRAALAIADVNKDETAQIAPGVNPARQSDRLPDVCRAQFVAMMCAFHLVRNSNAEFQSERI